MDHGCRPEVGDPVGQEISTKYFRCDRTQENYKTCSTRAAMGTCRAYLNLGTKFSTGSTSSGTRIRIRRKYKFSTGIGISGSDTIVIIRFKFRHLQ